MKSSMRELWGRKIILPPLARVMVAAAICLFVGYCTLNQMRQPEGLSTEAIRKGREGSE